MDNNPQLFEITISAKLSRRVGLETIELGIERTVRVANSEERSKHFYALEVLLRHEMGVYLSEFAPDIPPQGGEDMQPMGTTKIVPASRVVAEMKKGKWYFKVAGGEFDKFGVRIWDEVMHEIPFLQEDWFMGDGEVKFPNGWKMEVEMRGDKPVKVLRIIAPKDEPAPTS